jgi:hypothetical protein
MDKTSAGYHSGFFQSSKCESSRNRFSAAIEIHAGTARILYPVLQPQAPQGGHLFQGHYKAIVCDKDEYLLGLVRYIHLNPIRANMVRKVDEYPYSGHRELRLRGGARERGVGAREGAPTWLEDGQDTADLSMKA